MTQHLRPEPRLTAPNPHSPRAAVAHGLLLLLALPGLLSMVPAAVADQATTVATLPTPRAAPAAVWDGSNIYVMGGHDGSSYPAAIVRYNPAANTVVNTGASLASGRWAASAVWDGSNAYLFGGDDGIGNYDEIVRYSPAANTVTVMGAHLPSERRWSTAVWDGSNAYIFGGFHNGLGVLSDIVRYDPGTDTATTVAATLPFPIRDASAVWDGSDAYIFGGSDGTSLLNQIVRFHPATGTVTVLASTLPTARSQTSAAWLGSSAYIFGGAEPGSLAQIVRFTPGTGGVSVQTATLPFARVATAAAATSTQAFVFGGRTSPDNPAGALDSIVKYVPDATPSAPRNLTATGGLGQVSLNWQAPANDFGSPVTGYKVYRASSAAGPYSLIATLGNTLSYTDSGLGNGVTRWYRVSATNANGEGAQSASVSATTFNTPSAPQAMTASRGPDLGQISLSWQAPSSNGGMAVTGYNVYRASASTGPYARIATLGVVFSHTDSGLGNGTTRYYRVRAVNAVGEGTNSSTASATTFSSPSNPAGISATAGPGAGQITFNWLAPTNDGGKPVTGYKVYRSNVAAGPYNLIATLGNVLSYEDSGLGNGATWFYGVSALNLIGEGSRISGAGATTFVPPSAPQNPSAAQGPGPGQIKLAWQAPAANGGLPVTSYKVYRANAAAGPFVLIATLGNTLSYTDGGLGNGATRWYRISAVNAAGEGVQGATVSATTAVAPDAPRALLGAPGPNVGQAVLTWLSPSSNGGLAVTNYRIYRGTASGQETFLQEVGNVLTFIDDGLALGTTYYYRVTAVNAAGEGVASNEAVVLGTASDADADRVPDALEPDLCANENPFLASDGTCTGTNYAPPTLQGVLDDVDHLFT
jgi:fibronectin type 3 domain-containing protein/N-acetylneuraminic acid mutarotase